MARLASPGFAKGLPLSVASGAVKELERNCDMAQQKGGSGPIIDDPNEPVPVMQKILDNPFLLLFLGITIPTVFYIVWGVMEVAQIPIAR